MSNCIGCGKKLGGSEFIRCYQCKTNDNINDHLRKKGGYKEPELTNDELQGLVLCFWFVFRGTPYLNELFEWGLGKLTIFFVGLIGGYLIHTGVKSFFLKRFKYGRYLYLGLVLFLLVDVLVWWWDFGMNV